MTRPASLFPPAPYSRYQVCTWGSLLARWLDFSQVGLEPSLADTACPRLPLGFLVSLFSPRFQASASIDSTLCFVELSLYPLTLTHWITLTNFRDFTPFPMFRIYLGTIIRSLARSPSCTTYS